MQPKYVQFKLATGGYMRIDPVAPRSFRIRLRTTEAFQEATLIRYGILKNEVNMAEVRVELSDPQVIIDTGEAALHIDKKDGSFGIYREGFKRLGCASPPNIGPCGGFEMAYSLNENERLYGLGDQTRTRIGKRGHLAEMWVTNGTSYAPVPFVMSSRGWGLLVNTTWRHTIDAGFISANLLSISGNNGEFDIYLFAGDGLDDILNSYTDIAGKPALLPLRGYGLTFVCHELSDAREMIDDALRFRKENIPCDTIGLDRGWSEVPGDFSTGKRWHPSRFYIPSSLPKGPHTFIGTLERHGFHLNLMLVCDYDLSIYEEHLAGVKSNSYGTDASTSGGEGEDQRQAWYDHLRPFVDQGVSGFKLNGSNQTLPQPKRSWGNGMSDEEMHNLYPVLLGKQMYNGYSEQTGRRPMIYSVAGYTGFQQYVASWAGATISGPETLASLLNHGLSGHSNTSSDMDIFTPEGIHFGFLQSWSQINSWAYFRHPSLLEDRLLKLFTRYAKLRYRLLPYLYTAAHIATRTGLPIMRAMPLAFPDDLQAEALNCQYMLGDSLLVAAFVSHVYLPKGLWIDYWTGNMHYGPKHLDCTVPEDAGGPLFVRGGAIIPEWPEMDHVGRIAVEQLTVHVYPYQTSTFTLIEDDGVSFDFLDGVLATTDFRCIADDSRMDIRIDARTGQYEGMPKSRSYELCVHIGVKPSAVFVNGTLWNELTRKRSGQTTGGEKSWIYDRREGSILLSLKDPGKLKGSLHVRIMRGDLGSGRPTAGDSSDYAARQVEQSLARQKAEFELEVALESGNSGKAEVSFRKLWGERVGGPPLEDGFPEFSLLLGGLFTRVIERAGLSVKQTLGPDYEFLLNLQAIGSNDSAFELLCRMVRRIAEQMRTKRQSVHPLVRQMMELIERELGRSLTLQEVADRLHVTPSHLSRLFKKETGKTFSDFVTARKMECARQMLLNGCKVSTVAKSLGFEDPSYLSRVFRKFWGVAPNTYKA